MSTEPVQRAIDHIPARRNGEGQEMQVLSMGMSRTGTMSTMAALNLLGYRSYHAAEMFQLSGPDNFHFDAWIEALEAKIHGSSPLYSKKEFDKLLRNYSAVTDAPCICFAEELIEAYPDAKVLLAVRDPEKWIASMNGSWLKIMEHEELKWVRAVYTVDTTFSGKFFKFLHLPLQYWTGGDWLNRQKLIQAMHDHNDRIRELVPKERLLEWRPQDGWEPLCKFLGKPIPEMPMPNINKGNDAVAENKALAKARATAMLIDAVKQPALAVAVVSVVGVGAWFLARTVHWRRFLD